MLDRSPAAPVLEEVDVLLPRDADHDEEPVFGGDIEQPARRNRVCANRVEAVGGHL